MPVSKGNGKTFKWREGMDQFTHADSIKVLHAPGFYNLTAQTKYPTVSLRKGGCFQKNMNAL